MDKLKQYLEQHEDAMNIEVPDDELWKRMEAWIAARPTRTGIMRTMIKYLAVACIAGIAGISVWLIAVNNKKQDPRSDELVTNTKPKKIDTLADSDTSDLNHHEMALEKPPRPYSSKRPVHGPLKSAEPVQAELPMTETVSSISDGYNRVINYQLNKLRSTAIHAESPAYFSLFTTQLRKMEKDEQNLRADLHEYGFTNELLEQLINLYQKKLNVLKNLQVEINKMNNKVNEKQGPSQKGSKFYLNI